MTFFLLSLGLLAIVAADVSHLDSSYRLLKILKQTQDISPDGSYNYAYETENGIVADEAGHLGPVGPEGPAVVAQGSYKYVGADGATYEVQYTADENGFHPEGAHIPVVPEAIERSLKFIGAHPETRSNSQYKIASLREINIRPKQFRQ